MIGCCPPHPMPWNAVTGATVRCKATSIAYARKRRSVRAWRWICGVKPTPKAVNKPSLHSIVHGLDKPGVFTTVSLKTIIYYKNYLYSRNSLSHASSVLLSSRPMRSIRLVVALLHPRDELQHAFNRRRPQG